jgi:hypothetical protein
VWIVIEGLAFAFLQEIREVLVNSCCGGGCVMPGVKSWDHPGFDQDRLRNMA